MLIYNFSTLKMSKNWLDYASSIIPTLFEIKEKREKVCK